MASFDDFVSVSIAPCDAHRGDPPPPKSVSDTFYYNSHGPRPFTEGLMVDTMRAKHPHHRIAVINAFTCDFIAYANASPAKEVSCTTRGDSSQQLLETTFMPPSRRYGDENGGRFVEKYIFGAFDYVFHGGKFILYIVEGQDAMFKTRYSYLLKDEGRGGGAEAKEKLDELIEVASKWMQELHEEILIFDAGYWQKSKELWENVQKADWDDVILDKEMKERLQEDVDGFFDSEQRYNEFGVPWKRGVIFYGPPGNGKTISTKALMKDASKARSPAIESLYVKSFFSYQGPEAAIRQIFLKARQMAPCLLIFEDIDSLVLPNVRSYFLNEVDGLESNHGILMIGSTNHLDRLDPGISKRPSRFDRKYLFPVPSYPERIQYCEYWRHKLSPNKAISFPETMSVRIADITQDFSFAYMKEAFVAALLVIVRNGDGDGEGKRQRQRQRQTQTQRVWTEDDEDDSDDDRLEGNVLWMELKKQIESLRKEMDGEDDDDEVEAMLKKNAGAMWPGLSQLQSILGEMRTLPIDANVMPMYQ